MITRFFLWYDKQLEPKKFIIYMSSYLIGLFLVGFSDPYLQNKWIAIIGFITLIFPPIAGLIHRKKRKKVDAVIQKLDSALTYKHHVTYGDVRKCINGDHSECYDE